MAWSVLQSFHGVGPGTTEAITPTSNLTNGSKLIAVVGCDTGVGYTISGIGDGAGHNLVQLSTFRYGTGGIRTGVDIWVLDNTQSTKPTFTATSSASGIGLVILEVTGLATGTTTAACYDGTAGTSSWLTQSSPTPSPTYSSAATNEFLLSVVGDMSFAIATWSPPSGYTDASLQDPVNGSMLAAYKNSANGSESASWSWTGGGTDDAGGILVAFKLAAGVVAHPPQPLVSRAAVNRSGSW